MILEGADWENPSERLKVIRRCVKELNIDMMEDKDLKDNQTLSILMESHRCRKKGDPIYLEKLYTGLKGFNDYNVT
jgi:hypothetical protein